MARHFIKDALIPHVSQGAQIDYSSAQNQLPLETVDFGPQCNDILSTMPCETDLDQLNLRCIRQCCVNFYIKTVAGIASRFELGDGFLKDLSVFRPGIILDSPNRDTTFQSVWRVAQKFGGFDEAALKEEWRKIPDDFESDDDWRSTPLDELWIQTFGTREANHALMYPNLEKLFKIIRTLPNSNPDAERAFSMLTELVSKKRNHLSSRGVNGSCITASALMARGEEPQELDVTADYTQRMTSEKLYTPLVLKNRKKMALLPGQSD